MDPAVEYEPAEQVPVQAAVGKPAVAPQVPAGQSVHAVLTVLPAVDD